MSSANLAAAAAYKNSVHELGPDFIYKAFYAFKTMLHATVVVRRDARDKPPCGCRPQPHGGANLFLTKKKRTVCVSGNKTFL